MNQNSSLFAKIARVSRVLLFILSLQNNTTTLHTMSKQTLIAPSVLAADFANLQRDIEMINQSEADWFHIDIMDGVFVPNISFGMPVLEAINKHAKKTIDVHLMIVDPDRYIKTFKDLGSDILTVHYEACTHLHRTLQAIKAEGMKAGVALNPHTNVALLEDVINDIDLVCIMSVNPGFGGQSFIENTYKKVKQLKEIIVRNGANTLIEIDGGVTNKNARQLAEAGADVLVAGSYVFKAENPIATVADLKQITTL
jgi:ribulose-phosphate 3-epimerase